MALSNVSRFLGVGRMLVQRSIHIASAPSLAFDKPMPTPDAYAVGYEKIRRDAAKVGEDPFDHENRDQPTVLEGSGTKSDPFIVLSRNTKRLVCVDLGRDSGQPPCFWVTKEEGGRCPMTGRHYKLSIIEGDKWGINELDLFIH